MSTLLVFKILTISKKASFIVFSILVEKRFCTMRHYLDTFLYIKTQKLTNQIEMHHRRSSKNSRMSFHDNEWSLLINPEMQFGFRNQTYACQNGDFDPKIQFGLSWIPNDTCTTNYMYHRTGTHRVMYSLWVSIKKDVLNRLFK